MRHNFLGPTVTRVLHVHRLKRCTCFTPGPGNQGNGAWCYYEWNTCERREVREEGNQDRENRFFSLMKKKKSTKKNRHQERERVGLSFEGWVLLFNFFMKGTETNFVPIPTHIQDT